MASSQTKGEQDLWSNGSAFHRLGTMFSHTKELSFVKVGFRHRKIEDRVVLVLF